MTSSVIFLTLAIFLYSVSAQKNFTGYQVFRLVPENDAQVDFLERLEHSKINSLQDISSGIEFMIGASFPNQRVEILVNPENVKFVKLELTYQQISFQITVDNYQSLIDGQHDTTEALEEMAELYSRSTLLSTRRYYRYNEIVSYMSAVCRRGGNPCRRLYVGRSYEGRRMYVVKIGTDNGRKKVVWIDGGIHAREWIAPATASYLLGKLVERSAESKRMLKKYVFYVMPSINPDGYDFTWTHNRLWRKTRTHNRGSRCRGTDPNRNWSFKWGGVGTSNNPCSNTYHGTHAFSEPCTLATSRYLSRLRSRLHLYLSLHSYSQLWLTPWAHTRSLPRNYRDLKRAGDIAASRQSRVDGNYYRVGSTANILYKCSGASAEWAKGVLNTPYTYTIELPDRGRYGFVLPASKIDSTVRGMWAGLVALVNAI